MKVTINPFDEKSLTEAIGRLTDYCDFVENKATEQTVDELIEIGKEEAVGRIAGAIVANEPQPIIWTDGEGNERKIHTDKAGVFYEFGTGVMHSGWAGDGLPPGIVPHGMYGYGHGADPNGWWYKFDGRKWWTDGIDAVNFMWFAAQKIRKKTASVAKKVFKGRNKR